MGFNRPESYNGKVKVDVAQSTTIKKILAVAGDDKSVSHGLCMGYSAQWITKGAQGKDFWKWLDGSEAVPTLLQMAHRENTTMQVLQHAMSKDLQRDKSRMSDAMYQQLVADQETWAKQHIARTAGLEADPRVKGKFDPGAIAEKLIESDGFKLLDAIGTKKGSHAMAASVSGNKVVFMDPNHGEVHFDDKYEFAAWFTLEHFKQYKTAEFTDFYIDSFDAPVFPSEKSDSYHRSTAPSTLPTGSTSAAAAAAAAAAAPSPDPAPASSSSAPAAAWVRAVPGGRGTAPAPSSPPTGD